MHTDLPEQSAESSNSAAGQGEPDLVTRGVAAVRHRMSLRVLAFTLGAIAAAGTGIGLGQLAAVAAAPSAVVIRDFSFGPATLTVARGTTVTWTNRDGEPHRVVNAAEPKAFQSPALDTNDTFSFQFDKAGTYRYFCSIHPRMTGTVVVK
jgi:plastocyanin